MQERKQKNSLWGRIISEAQIQERKQTQVLKMNLKLLASIVTTYIKYNLAARQSINSNTAGLLTSVPITQNMSSFKQKITQHARREKKKSPTVWRDKITTC